MESSHVFAAQLLDALPESEISEIQQHQNEMSLSLQKASSSLSALNEFSAVKWAHLSPKFEAHTKLIKELQVDLDYVFRKIRSIKSKLNLPNLEDDEEDGNGTKKEEQEEEDPNKAGNRKSQGDGEQQEDTFGAATAIK